MIFKYDCWVNLLILNNNCRCDMARGRNADDSAIRLARSPADDGDDITAVDAHSRMEHLRARRVQRLHFNNRLDRRLPHDKHARA